MAGRHRPRAHGRLVPRRGQHRRRPHRLRLRPRRTHHRQRPAARLRPHLGDDELRWELAPDGDGTLLTFTHTFADRHGAASFAAGWHTCLAALHAHLDERPFPGTGDTARLHEDFIAILGLPAATVTDGGVRVERQLTRPAEDVWQRLGGPEATVGAPPPQPFTVPAAPPGPVSRIEAGKLLEYDTGGGTVRWELAAGTGHGARLVLTHAGQTATLDAWRVRVEELAASLL